MVYGENFKRNSMLAALNSKISRLNSKKTASKSVD